MNFKEDLKISGINRQAWCEIFGITERTLRNWERFGAPQWACERISLAVGNHPSWNGIRILNGTVVTRNGYVYNANQLDGLSYWLGTMDRLVNIQNLRIEELESLVESKQSSNSHSSDCKSEQTLPVFARPT